ncbi:hypothetical protein GF342_05810 [Candidatus Woesearchaeota archaeon]|nr:hypothetical protein [Candidatus Woesearchaeota archaeon]
MITLPARYRSIQETEKENRCYTLFLNTNHEFGLTLVSRGGPGKKHISHDEISGTYELSEKEATLYPTIQQLWSHTEGAPDVPQVAKVPWAEGPITVTIKNNTAQLHAFDKDLQLELEKK